MWIQRVVATAFGPFRGERLELAPGLTVVTGANEAGKSTWHAALRLALTGVRRGKGPGTQAERQLAERHRPWDASDRWEVEARLHLRDGRVIDVRQDLAGKVDCRAVEIALGRDVSGEILDGTPDASRWLGLNRDAFASTVSVSQSQILAVAGAADQLQEQMQRAAASHGADATAAQALGRLDQFRRDAVGVDRVGARGPLRTAKDRLAAAEARLLDARRQHHDFLDWSARADAADERVAEARREVLRLEAGLARARAAQVAERAARAGALAARHPGPPEPLVARDERADAVAGALDAWTSRPEPVLLNGLSSDELEAALAALPEVPEGDLEPHVSVTDAFRALELAEAALAAIEEPRAVEGPPLPAVEETRVRELARRLRLPQITQAPALEAELSRARAAAEGAGGPSWIALGGAVALLIAATFVGVPLANAPAGGALLVAAALLAATGWWIGSGSRRAAARVARAEAALAPYRNASMAAERDRAAAEAEARSTGLPTDPARLDELGDRLAAAAAARTLEMDGARRREALLARGEAAWRTLAAALLERGVRVEQRSEATSAMAAYRAECNRRAEQAREAARREGLESRLETRRTAERAAAAANAARAAAERRLRQAAAAVGLDPRATPEALVEALEAWQRDRALRLRRNEEAIGEWQQLLSLLDGRDLRELQESAAAAQHAAETLGHMLPPGEAPGAGVPEELERRLVVARDALASELSAADELRGGLRARRESLPDVAEAEEATVAARGELQRVQRLAEVLEHTTALLRAAEERVHRDLAPVLARTIGRWLPQVCAGAYVDVAVDPADLAVRVKEAGTGIWREARLLSEGTREQIYLLLRVAMAEHLVTNGEVAPLLLDEVTVQADADRKRQLLDVLHVLSGERQVVLFTHDDDVVAWAERSLVEGRDALVRLAGRIASPPPQIVPGHAPVAAALGD